MKTIVERGASWTLDETKLLLALWGQDLVKRSSTNLKRNKEVYEKIAAKLNLSDYERTAEQVRTRVFNMIAEYRRILKDPNPERQKKCLFFDRLHRIYQARHMDDVKSALDDFEPEGSFSPMSSMTIEDRSDETMANDSTTTTETDIATDTTTSNNNNNNTNNNNIKSEPQHGVANTSNQQQSTTNTTTNNNNQPQTSSTLTQLVTQPGNSTSSSKSSSSLLQIPTTSNVSMDTNSSGVSNDAVPVQGAGSGNGPSNVKKTYSNLATQNNSSVPQQNQPQQSTSAVNNNQTKSLLINQSFPGSVTTTQAYISGISSTLQTSGNGASGTTRHQSLLLPHGSSISSHNNFDFPQSAMAKLANSTGSTSTPSFLTINSGKPPTLYRTNQLIGHPTVQVTNGNTDSPSNGNTGAGATARVAPNTATIASHQLYQAPVNTFDVTSSALLIDRVFAHLSRESENMREWISLEKERLALEKARRQTEAEREARREKLLVETLMRFQKEWVEQIEKIVPNTKKPATTTSNDNDISNQSTNIVTDNMTNQHQPEQLNQQPPSEPTT